MGTTFVISHLPASLRYSNGLRVEIQLVDDFGQTLDSVFVGDNESDVLLRNTKVPDPVLAKARQLAVGETRCVDILGNATYPGRESVEPTLDNVFFVIHLKVDDRWHDQQEGQFYQVQLVNRFGQATASGFVSKNDHTLKIGATVVPRAVIDAAQRQPTGSGEYVDANGEAIPPGSWQPVGPKRLDK
jgi:hypothetical protein